MMRAQLGDTAYALHLVGDDTVAVARGEVVLGTFTYSHHDSGVRVRMLDDLARIDDVRLLIAIGRAWFEQAVEIAAARGDQGDDDADCLARAVPEPRRHTGTRTRVGTVLVVAPEAAFRNFMALALRRRGYDVECAGTAAEARARLVQHFAVVVATADLPDGDGHEVLELHRRENGARTVALVGPGSAAAIAAERRAVVDDVIEVPCHVVAIVQTVERLVPIDTDRVS